MRISVINPNSTESMTDKIAAAARAVAAPDVQIEGRTCAGSPASIQGPDDGAAALPHLLAEVTRAFAQGADACLIACFDDTGLAEARATAPGPVIGIGEAAFHAAMLLGHRFSVITTLSVSVPVIDGVAAACGMAQALVRLTAPISPIAPE